MRSFESAMRAALGAAVVEEDLSLKHQKMAERPFLFLRATCWRWAEAAPRLCPELMDGPVVPSVGDAHAGNFGLWRDAEARLVWGVDDYDEAAMLPYGLDLVRLVASLLLADRDDKAADIAEAALSGYRDGLNRPTPYVLERDHIWLRDAFAASDEKREKFWNGLDDAPAIDDVPPEMRAVLLAALPNADPKIARRSAGTGSLGRPRFVASGEYRGGPVAAEVKALLPSCWGDAAAPGLAQKMVAGRWRSPDPTLSYGARHVVRRLAPNSGKVDFGDILPKLKQRLIGAMASDLAAIHGEQDDVRSAVIADLGRRGNGWPGDSWLAEAAARVADWTRSEFESYRIRKP